MLHVIGLGVAEQASLDAAALAALQASSRVIGSARQLATVAGLLDQQQQLILPPLAELGALLGDLDQQQTALLASGDPLYFGIGRWLGQRYAPQQLTFYPAVSSIQAACHQLGLSLQDVQVVSLHGRPLAALRRHLARQRYLLLLTDQYSHPQAVAALCTEAGFGRSRLWVCEQLGYPEQQVRQFVAEQLAASTDDADFSALQVTVLEVQGNGRSYLPVAPGIADQYFITGGEAGQGLLTKREVRMAILGLLQPAPAQVGWDIGAGCGGVAIEWALLQASSTVYAIEHHAERLKNLRANCERFGVVENLQVIAGRAPACLADLPVPAQIFVGGSDGELAEMLAACWERLLPGGVLVVSAVMESSRAQCLAFADRLADDPWLAAMDTVQIAVSKGGRLAGQWVYRPKLPVALFQFIKQTTEEAV